MRFCKSKEHDFKNICSVERADYTFVSIGPGWIDKEMMKENFQYIHENYQERLTLSTAKKFQISAKKVFPDISGWFINILNNFYFPLTNLISS